MGPLAFRFRTMDVLLPWLLEPCGTQAPVGELARAQRTHEPKRKPKGNQMGMLKNGERDFTHCGFPFGFPFNQPKTESLKANTLTAR